MGITGLCLSPADIAISKLAAGREKDMIFVKEMIRAKIVTIDELTCLLPGIPDTKVKTLQERIALVSKM
jgi:hypothetical protein